MPAKLDLMECDRIAGIPYAALPIGMAVSLASGVPLIYNRKESKSHGLGKEIEGLWQPGERVVIIEDVITTGGSIVSSVELFRAAGLVVEDAIVLLDRQQGGVENLARGRHSRPQRPRAGGRLAPTCQNRPYSPEDIRQTLSAAVPVQGNGTKLCPMRRVIGEPN